MVQANTFEVVIFFWRGNDGLPRIQIKSSKWRKKRLKGGLSWIWKVRFKTRKTKLLNSCCWNIFLSLFTCILMRRHPGFFYSWLTLLWDNFFNIMGFSKAPLHSSFISFQVTPRMMNNMSFEVIHSPPQHRASSREIQFSFWGQNWKINCWWCTHWWKCRSVVGAKAKLSNELFLLPPHPPLTKACAGQARCQTDFLSHLKSKQAKAYCIYIHIHHQHHHHGCHM